MNHLGALTARRTLRSILIGTIVAVSMSTAADARASNGFFGVLPQEYMTLAEMKTAKAGGIESLRLPLSRRMVQRSENDWVIVDTFVGNAARAGLTVLPTVYGSTPRDSSDRRWLPNTTEGLSTWNELLERAAGRYGSNGTFWTDHPSIPRMPITVWQIWNEVNTLWFAPSISPGDYANLVINSSKTIKAVDPDAKILLSGLVGTPRPESGMRADAYLKKLYGTSGFRNSFDLAAIHPYEVTVPDSLQDIVDLRATLDRFGDRDKEIYVTELGWGSDSKTAFGMGSQAAQARYLGSAFKSIILRKPALKVHAVYWFTWKDLTDGQKACVFCYETGLFDRNGAPKASWQELTTLIERERTNPGDPGPFDPTPGTTDPVKTGSGTKQCRKLRPGSRKRKRCRIAAQCRKRKSAHSKSGRLTARQRRTCQKQAWRKVPRHQKHPVR